MEKDTEQNCLCNQRRCLDKSLFVLVLFPFIGIVGGTTLFANREPPFVLGMPFILFWIVYELFRLPSSCMISKLGAHSHYR